MRASPEPLDPRRHDRVSFDCGHVLLDRWLREHAGQAQRRDGSRTYVLCEDDVVIGYYSLCAFSVTYERTPATLRLGRHPVPAVLLARLAVDRRWQGVGVGSVLLLDALAVAARVADAVGARVLVVDAIDDSAARFYGRHGFKAFATDSRTLYLAMKDIRRTLGL